MVVGIKKINFNIRLNSPYQIINLSLISVIVDKVEAQLVLNVTPDSVIFNGSPVYVF